MDTLTGKTLVDRELIKEINKLADELTFAGLGSGRIEQMKYGELGNLIYKLPEVE